MSRISAFTLTTLALLAAACSEPRCPKSYVQDDHYCRRCPEGSEPKHNQCITLDGGEVVEPVDEDAGGDEQDAAAADGGAWPGDWPDEKMDAASSGADARANASAEGGVSSADTAVESDASASSDANSSVSDSATDASVDAGPPCYADKDKDGVGAGQPISCEGYGTDAGAGLSLTNNDCDDNNDKRSPSLSDVCGDNIDNDCDGTPDDESNNACGGPCTTQLAHQPGEKCTNGLLGACAREGGWQCQGKTATVCNAPSAAASAEACGDGVDNDCDGSKDEADAIDATTWYEDCDGDGFSAVTDALIAAKIGIRTACVKPAATVSCAGGWTATRPQAPAPGVLPQRWDCDDTTGAYRPLADYGLPPEGKTSTDLDCSGVSEKEPAIGIIDGFFQVITPVKACSAATDCTSCAASGGRGQWLSDDKVTPTDTLPTCSANMGDLRAWRSIDWANSIGRCPMNRYFDNWSGGWQRCK